MGEEKSITVPVLHLNLGRMDKYGLILKTIGYISTKNNEIMMNNLDED